VVLLTGLFTRVSFSLLNSSSLSEVSLTRTYVIA